MKVAAKRFTAPIKFRLQLEFIIKLIQHLQEPVTMKSLMDRLCVDERTVYRWIDHLAELGFEVCRSEGTNPRTFQIKGGSVIMWEKGLDLMVYSDPNKK